MKIRIRDWNNHFEQDRSKQWKNIKWVPIPNKQGHGYRKIMNENDGLNLFACWIALVQVASLCTPRGDLSKYTLHDLSLLTLIEEKYLKTAIEYLSKELDWLEVIENLDKNVIECQKNVIDTAVGSSILFSSIQSNSIQFKESINTYINIYPQKMLDDFFTYWSEPQRSNKKLRFELEPTWELSRRLSRWAKNDKSFIKPATAIKIKDDTFRMPKCEMPPATPEEVSGFVNNMPLFKKNRPIKSGDIQPISEIMKGK